ncbi:lytic polysaccharide monooxygenase [Paractinoplanes brasiliensis]|uniref:Carbohydrate binding protein n=1 Tax=Paractinoplanes brasiliensis TaxID=52695 RepID=A0A4R6JTA0_9ACTN|nr:lytic polysaccharide monooxygenase [Actinoplanes brasiliensis]TDO39729.1 carbohydrate binding protein [Actinoplanes brasiliensis]GID28934.1 cellulose-binding protein [Actinoplanes brasiliensis]
MRRKIAYPLVALGMTAGATVGVVSPASAHGYVSSPPSRQALCASGKVADCGAIQFEPQSVEGPKGLKSCDGGLAGFSVLGDESRNWPATTVGSSVQFSWVLTARHRTSTWEYYVGGTKVATIDDGGAQPAAVVNHTINLSKFPGRQKVLAVWNIADTPNAFYNCVDLNVGGGGNTPAEPTKPPTAAPTKAPTVAPKPTTPPAAPAAPAGGSWAAGTAYKTGDVVTFNGAKYQCRQSHTALSSWEPSIYTLALWLPL